MGLVHCIITQVEDVLIKSGVFSLPKRREVSEADPTVVLIDATETPVERPQKNSGPRPYYSGKKKRHTLKSPFVVDVVTRQILATAHTPGSTHDLALLRQHNPHLQPDTWVVADSGYQVLDKTAPAGPVRKETYRDCRKRFSLRFKLIAGLVNAGLQVSS